MRLSAYILCMALVGWSLAAQARLEITVTGGAEGALPIAVADFLWSGEGIPPQDLAAIVRADLRRCGRFAPYVVETPMGRVGQGGEFDYTAWRSTGSEQMVIGQIQSIDGHYRVEFQLLDLLRGEQMTGYSIDFTTAEARGVAHRISDIIYQQLLGEPGAFATHIAYVTHERMDNAKQRYRLSIADSDGYNEQVILSSSKSLLSPAWATDGRRLAYVSFENGRSEVYLQDVDSGRREVVASYSGLNSSPAWSPDGSRLALTLSHEGNPEIYLLNLSRRSLQRITHSSGIDTEANWSPDGRSIVFTSDRGGGPQIYRVGVGSSGATGRPRRLTFEGKYNARANFSPDGKRIALVHGAAGAYRIAVLDLASQQLRVLTESRLDETPSFAPNGSMIIYATEIGGSGVLEAVSVDGSARQRLGLRLGDVREPAWSPKLSRQERR